MSATSRLTAFVSRRVWLMVALVAAAYWFSMGVRWRAGGWLVTQLAPLPTALLSSPIPVGHESDINFWIGQSLGVLFICMLTFAVISTSKSFDEWALKYLFRSSLQRTLFRHLLLRSVKDVVFMFTSRQVRVQCALRWPRASLLACVGRLLDERMCVAPGFPLAPMLGRPKRAGASLAVCTATQPQLARAHSSLPRGLP
jgi:hypothetical protein